MHGALPTDIDNAAKAATMRALRSVPWYSQRLFGKPESEVETCWLKGRSGFSRWIPGPEGPHLYLVCSSAQAQVLCDQPVASSHRPGAFSNSLSDFVAALLVPL